GDVIDAVIDQVFADRIVAPGGKGNFQLRPDSIGGTHEYGTAKAAKLKARAKAADFSQDSGSEWAAGEFADGAAGAGRFGGGDGGAVSFGDVYAGVAIENTCSDRQIPV